MEEIKDIEEILNSLKDKSEELVSLIDNMFFEETLNEIAEKYEEGTIDDVIDMVKNKVFKKQDINNMNYRDAMEFTYNRMKLVNELMGLKKLDNNKEDALKLTDLLLEYLMEYRIVIKMHMEDK